MGSIGTVVEAYRCTTCSWTGPEHDGTSWGRCPTCSGVLDVAAAPSGPDHLDVDPQRQGVWRYRGEYPATLRPTSLGEPTTPLLRWDDGTRGEILLKLEGCMPTGSFKDRGAALMVSHLAARRVREITTASSGNAGGAVASYCRAVGIRATVFVPAGTSQRKTDYIEVVGGVVSIVDGDRDDATIAARHRASVDRPFVSHTTDPYFVVGTGSFVYELWEQLEGRLPDAIVIPVGAGTLYVGAYLAARRLRDRGLVGALPRLLGVQVRPGALVRRTKPRGGTGTSSVDGDGVPSASARPSRAEGTAISDVPRAEQILAIARETGGAMVEVDEEAVAEAHRDLGARGLGVEFTAAVALAGARQVPGSWLRHRAAGTVVVAVTGHAWKAL